MQSTQCISRSPLRLLTGLAVVATSVLAADMAHAVSCFPAKPVNTMLITSNYGVRKHPNLQGVTRLHAGSDLRAAVGTPVFAVEDGRVLNAMPSASAGNMVVVVGADNKWTRYLHLDRFFVSAGDTIKAGQQIANSGNTGNTTRVPHLHFEVKLNNGKDPTDPRPYLCNPPEKPGAGPDPTLNPSAPAPGTPSASPITNGVPNNDYPPMGPSPTAAVAVPQASSLGDPTGMSTLEYLQTESARRFGNPQWYRDLRDPLDVMRNHPNPEISGMAANMPPGNMVPMLLREIVFMQNLTNFYAIEEKDRKARMEQMLATDLADRVNLYSEKVLRTLRSEAMKTTK